MERQARIRWMERLIYIGGWCIAWGAILISIQSHADVTRMGRDIIGFSLFLLTPFLILFLVNNCWLVPCLLMRRRFGLYALLLLAVMGILFYFFFLQRIWVTGHLSFPAVPGTPPPPFPPNSVEPMLVVVAFLLIGFNVAVKLFFKSLHDDEVMKELEKRHLESELRCLKYQLNPHFFMNTLNNIYVLVDIDAVKAKETILKLSKLMGYVLYEAVGESVSLVREVRFLQSYMALMKMRYTEKLVVTADFPFVVPDVPVPPLLFISLLENAFKHGVSSRASSFVEVKMRVEGEDVFFSCRNSNHKCRDMLHSGVGLDNVRKRLALLYGRNYTLTVTEDKDSYSVLLIVPVL